jgi:thiol:disulfide interchange protein
LAIFLAMGLGMSSPYITIGIFPEAVKFLPRPGNWMNTFKQLMGFVLLGTVVFLLTSLQTFYVVPTIALLFGLSIACWLVGDMPLTASSTRKWTTRAVAVGLAVAAIVISFAWIAPMMYERDERSIALRIDHDRENRSGAYVVENIPWQPYTAKKLQWLLDNGKTVVVDFTADWCLNCKVNERVVLKTQATQDRFLADDVYSLVADWTHRSEAKEVTAKLEELGAKQIPLVAIYSAADPNKPILLPGILQAHDVYTKVDEANARSRASAAIAAPLSANRTAMIPTP